MLLFVVMLMVMQKTEHRPDIVGRVFKLKVKQLVSDITKKTYFGRAATGNIFFFICLQSYHNG